MHQFVILRHGESVWNHENRFTGWKDVDLSSLGVEEARTAGKTLLQSGLNFDQSHTSVLKRAIKTLHLALEEMDQLWLPVQKSWRLNERHYGALTGLNKAQTAALHGEEQVKIWRRSYDVPPPLLPPGDSQLPQFEDKYKSVNPKDLPLGESLKDTVERFLPYWQNTLQKEIALGKTLLVVAHGNSLRALIQNLENLTADEIMKINIPTGIPLLYRLDAKMKVLEKKYLGDPAVVEKAIAKVEGQGKIQNPAQR